MDKEANLSVFALGVGLSSYGFFSQLAILPFEANLLSVKEGDSYVLTAIVFLITGFLWLVEPCINKGSNAWVAHFLLIIGVRGGSAPNSFLWLLYS